MRQFVMDHDACDEIDIARPPIHRAAPRDAPALRRLLSNIGVDSLVYRYKPA